MMVCRMIVHNIYLCVQKVYFLHSLGKQVDLSRVCHFAVQKPLQKSRCRKLSNHVSFSTLWTKCKHVTGYHNLFFVLFLAVTRLRFICELPASVGFVLSFVLDSGSTYLTVLGFRSVPLVLPDE